jgi:hypothetical protein
MAASSCQGSCEHAAAAASWYKASMAGGMSRRAGPGGLETDEAGPAAGQSTQCHEHDHRNSG